MASWISCPGFTFGFRFGGLLGFGLGGCRLGWDFVRAGHQPGCRPSPALLAELVGLAPHGGMSLCEGVARETVPETEVETSFDVLSAAAPGMRRGGGAPREVLRGSTPLIFDKADQS